MFNSNSICWFPSNRSHQSNSVYFVELDEKMRINCLVVKEWSCLYESPLLCKYYWSCSEHCVDPESNSSLTQCNSSSFIKLDLISDTKQYIRKITFSVLSTVKALYVGEIQLRTRLLWSLPYPTTVKHISSAYYQQITDLVISRLLILLSADCWSSH